VSSVPISFSGSPTAVKVSPRSVELSPMPDKSSPIAELLSGEEAKIRMRSPHLRSPVAAGRRMRASNERRRSEKRSRRHENVGRRTKPRRNMTTFHIDSRRELRSRGSRRGGTPMAARFARPCFPFTSSAPHSNAATSNGGALECSAWSGARRKDRTKAF
jgi:hypothetical protein